MAWQAAIRSEPFEHLIMADNGEDVKQAREAIGHLGSKVSDQIEGNIGKFWLYLDRLRPSWRLALLRLIVHSRPKRDHLEISFDWSKNAEKFDPSLEIYI